MNHVSVWGAGCQVRITDMTDAHKRGKTCAVLRFSGWRPQGSDDESVRSNSLCWEVERWCKVVADRPFGELEAELRALVARAELPAHCAAFYVESIKAIDAPQELLTAGVDGKWNAKADESGIVINDETDQNNLPCSITIRQTNARAYQIARKVWDRVKAAGTFYQAQEVLRLAGASLHQYCRMD